MSDSRHPDTIGRYRIVRPLGSGAMGDVYLATDPHIDRELAIKTVRVLAGTPEDVAERKQRLLREAKAAGKLLHPHVVTLFDADEVEGVLYLAFEYVPGTDLAKRVATEPPPTLRQALTWGRDVARALHYAHGRNIVHRDIKPSNILLGEDGTAKVADFGIAKLYDQATELTRTGMVIGSPQYMSPEQVRGDALDGRSDVFSLGVVVYELLSRRRPFAGETLSTLVFEILGKEPPALDSMLTAVPERLVRVVHQALEKEAADRPASAGELADALDAVLRDTPADRLDSAAADQGDALTQRIPSSGVASAGARALTAERPLGGSAVGSGAAAGVGPSTPPPTPPPLPPTGASSPLVPPPSPPPASGPQVAAPASHAVQPAAPPSSMGVPAAQALPHRTPEPRSSRPWLIGLAAVGCLGFLAVAALLFLALRGRETPDRVADVAPSTPPAVESPASAAGAPVAERSADRLSTSSTLSDNASAQIADLSSPVDAPPDDRSSGAEEAAPASRTDSEAGLPDDAPPDRERPSGDSPDSTQQTAEPPPAWTPPPSAPAAEPRVDTVPGIDTPGIDTPGPDPMRDAAPPPPSLRSEPGGADPELTTAVAPEPTLSRAEQRFIADAETAVASFETGRRLRLEVEPDDTVIKFRQRGERSIVQGQASEFEADERDARDLELPIDGDYLLYFIRDGYADVIVRLDARAGQGAAAQVLQVSMRGRTASSGR
ncbi:MAG: protein kinase [Acidobacteriota bacterium]